MAVTKSCTCEVGNFEDFVSPTNLLITFRCETYTQGLFTAIVKDHFAALR